MFVQICIAIYLVLIIPILEMISYIIYSKQIKAGTFSNRKFYFSCMLELWIPVIVLLVFVLIENNLTIQNLGLNKPIFNFNNLNTIQLILVIITVVIPILWILLSAYQIININISKEYRKAYYDAVGKKLKSDETLKIKLAILPKNIIDRILWIGVSITAGITEEILFRGFIVYFMSILFPELPLWSLMLIQTIPFCLMHIYQGVNGVITTALVGLIMAAYSYLFGSIIIAIIVHILIDLSSIFIEKEQTQSVIEKEDD